MPTPESCRNCRRPIFRWPGMGWLHGEAPRYADEPISCQTAHPSGCKHRISEPCPLDTKETTNDD